MRKRYSGRLVRKELLSGSQQCFHLEFAVDAVEQLVFEPGQFISCIATDGHGKQQTRAYSLASAPRENRFELCLNRVEGGFFSNFLCDLAPGDLLEFDEPMGTFTLMPVSQIPQVENLFLATGTGVAPLRGFVEWLFPQGAASRRPETQFTLIYGTRHSTELYYRDYFEETAKRFPNFRYLPTLSRPDAHWTGWSGYVQEQAARLIEANPPRSDVIPQSPGDRGPFDRYAYVCGFRDMITATRERFTTLGWVRRQIIAERYD
jgi:ferredoxin-NADP reductase